MDHAYSTLLFRYVGVAVRAEVAAAQRARADERSWRRGDDRPVSGDRRPHRPPIDT